MKAEKTTEEINDKIRAKRAIVLTAEEMKRYITENGIAKSLEKVDVVTTGTFGAMCSSGAFLNFGHADPPLKMEKLTLNGVPIYGGIAAVDAYLGATERSEKPKTRYGGAHVIEDLVAGKRVALKAKGKPTDCYPSKSISTDISLADMNQAILLNPRKAYQRYNAGANSTDKTIY
ncbi:MAG: homocysteine biosynthesis protein, partial [Candidatus Marinimicrobia bacterium]|nr:homocysteine biosynthesis protein [Candidatus Neomarinimicrobiota bacterium]